MQFVSELMTHLLEVLVVFRDDVFGHRFITTVSFVHKEPFLQRAEQRSQKFRRLQARPQIAQEYTANTYTLVHKLGVLNLYPKFFNIGLLNAQDIDKVRSN